METTKFRLREQLYVALGLLMEGEAPSLYLISFFGVADTRVDIRGQGIRRTKEQA